MKHIPVGMIVTVERPDRGEDGESRLIPAIVLGQWPSGDLELYLFHFEGVPSYARSVPLSTVRMVGQTQPIEKANAMELLTT